MRSKKEIDREVKALKGLVDKVPAETCFGESNEEAINAQVRALEGRQTEDDAWERYGDDEENRNRECAIDAIRWMFEEEDIEAPSVGWEDLVR